MLQTLHPSSVVTSYASAVLRAMQGESVILVAAGVALMNEADDLLLLQRPDGEWDLPGGHMEVGESLEETALRELFEETGLTVDALELLGVASGRGVFHRERNAYYVTALYRAVTSGSSIRLSQEHLDGFLLWARFLPLYQCPSGG